jgi:hypothetical protein
LSAEKTPKSAVSPMSTTATATKNNEQEQEQEGDAVEWMN